MTKANEASGAANNCSTPLGERDWQCPKCQQICLVKNADKHACPPKSATVAREPEPPILAHIQALAYIRDKSPDDDDVESWKWLARKFKQIARDSLDVRPSVEPAAQSQPTAFVHSGYKCGCGGLITIHNGHWRCSLEVMNESLSEPAAEGRVDAIFKEIMGAIDMPADESPDYDRWLFDKTWKAARASGMERDMACEEIAKLLENHMTEKGWTDVQKNAAVARFCERGDALGVDAALGFTEWYAKQGGPPYSMTMPIFEVVKYAERYAEYIATRTPAQGTLRYKVCEKCGYNRMIANADDENICPRCAEGRTPAQGSEGEDG